MKLILKNSNKKGLVIKGEGNYDIVPIFFLSTLLITHFIFISQQREGERIVRERERKAGR